MNSFQGVILVTGGAGYIGSYTVYALLEAGYDVVVLDNLSRGKSSSVDPRAEFIEGDIRDACCLRKLFSNYRCDAVVHFAALIDVGASVRDPERYYDNNVSGSISLLKAMVEAGVSRFLFSSSAAIFGNPERLPIDENHRKAPMSPYGRSKLIVEEILSDLCAAGKLSATALRYFNAAGGDPAGLVSALAPHPTNLIPIALHALCYGDESVTLFGNGYPTADGSCLRDYIHIVDLARAHVLTLGALLKKTPKSTSFLECYNLGNGRGFSVYEVLAAVQEVTQRRLKVLVGPPRAGDPPVLIANAAKIQQALGWQPEHSSLREMIADHWNLYCGPAAFTARASEQKP